MDDEFADFEKKNKNHLLKIEQKLDTEVETLQRNIEKSEKTVTNMFNKLRVDVENLLQRSHHKVEIISNDLNETISKVHEKLRRVDETSTVKDWVYTLVEEKMEVINTNSERFNELDERISKQKTDLTRIVSNLQKTFAGKFEEIDNFKDDMKFSINQGHSQTK